MTAYPLLAQITRLSDPDPLADKVVVENDTHHSTAISIYHGRQCQPPNRCFQEKMGFTSIGKFETGQDMKWRVYDGLVIVAKVATDKIHRAIWVYRL